MIFFRDRHLSPAQHVAFARRFGELQVHPFLSANAEHPELDLAGARVRLYAADGRLLGTATTDSAGQFFIGGQLLTQTGITASGKEAKRLIAEGGLRLNNEPVNDPQTPVDAGLIGDGLKVSVGKKKHRMLRLG